jgi:hypothetical protein
LPQEDLAARAESPQIAECGLGKHLTVYVGHAVEVSVVAGREQRRT